MKAKTKYNSCKTWRGRVKVIYLFHSIKLSRDNKWGLRDTAQYFHISLGAVSEAISLAMNLNKVSKIKNRRDALDYIKRNQ